MEYTRFPCPNSDGYGTQFPDQLLKSEESSPMGFYRRGQKNEKFIIELEWTLSLSEYIDFMTKYIAHRSGIPFLIRLPFYSLDNVDYRASFVSGTFNMRTFAKERYIVNAIVECMKYVS